jgi:sodium transport system permease protein
MNATFTVFCKELRDALRDRRTLAVVLLSSVLMGPLVLVALSSLLANMQAQAERRVVVLAGAEHAPSLKNYIERQTFTVQAAPPAYEAALREAQLGEPVLVVPAGFEAALQAGEVPVLTLVSDSGNKRAQGGVGRVMRLVEGFKRERGQLALALRGVAPELLEPVQLELFDLASQSARAAQLTALLPFFVIMAVLYGALNAALDTTAGERERGSLEPLLGNPVPLAALVWGKWAAVLAVALLIAVLSCVSFVPAQWLLRSDTLQALFQFGLREVLGFVAVLLPLAAALSSLLMAVAVRCKTFKEAQAASSVLVLGVSLLPLVTVFDPSGEAPWHQWLPALAQHSLMTRLLKAEAVGLQHMAVPLAVCTVLTLAGVWFVARRLRAAALR